MAPVAVRRPRLRGRCLGLTLRDLVVQPGLSPEASRRRFFPISTFLQSYKRGRAFHFLLTD